jgi:hypothetical protein
MILACSIGKLQLSAGQPLLASVRLDAESIDLRSGLTVKGDQIVPWDRPEVTLRSVESRAEFRPDSIELNLPPNVIAMETTDLQTGAYEIGIKLSGQEVWVSENLWILERDLYHSVLVDESREKFARYPSISSSAELQQVFRDVAFCVFPRLSLPVESTFLSEIPIPAAAIEWITRTILETFHYISAFGLMRPSGFVVVNGTRVELGVNANLEYPLPEAVVASLHDRYCSDVYLLNGSRDLEDFDVDLSVDHQTARIAVRQSWPQLVLELA